MQAYKTKNFSIVPGADTGWMETKIDVQGRKVMGYLAAFGNVDSDGDVIYKGAFAKTLAERGPASRKNRIVFLRDHDSSKVAGRMDVLIEDDKGLYFEAQLANTPLGDETLELYKMKALTEHSIGYQTVKQRYDQEAKANVLEEIKLWEGSVVPWGANPETPLVGIKGHKGYIERMEALAKQAPDEEYKSKLLLLIEQLKAETTLTEALEVVEKPADEATGPADEPLDGVEMKLLIDELIKLKQAFRRQ